MISFLLHHLYRLKWYLSFHLHNRHSTAATRLAFQCYPAVPRRLMLHLPDCAGFPICQYRYEKKVCRYNFV